ncbi:hypothetical protein HPB47_013178 [Ixodes persulcatus]|uniref:Uncharacterized protein n=1 Tax=Ixodes persulcatus TaxID=34615 RepID=A0AC60NRH4_IXOPE|nr:hypothetical protein HPB47_013178 [Ixodes persulcatus]
MVDYRGMRRVCSRCGQEGHFGPACKTPRCDRCGVFGHPTEGCAAPCQRCGHAHATTDCVQRKTYSAAARVPPWISATGQHPRATCVPSSRPP